MISMEARADTVHKQIHREKCRPAPSLDSLHTHTRTPPPYLPQSLAMPAFLSPLHLSPPLQHFIKYPPCRSFTRLSPISHPPKPFQPHRARTSNLIRSMATGGFSESDGVPRSVPVHVAHELLQAGHHYLDVRSEEEFNGGHAVGAKNIPYMFKVGQGMKKNPNFLTEVSAVFGKDDEIIVGCLSGKRSLMAANELLSDGFTSITDIQGGFSAWVQNGLPTTQ